MRVLGQLTEWSDPGETFALNGSLEQNDSVAIKFLEVVTKQKNNHAERRQLWKENGNIEQHGLAAKIQIEIRIQFETAHTKSYVNGIRGKSTFENLDSRLKLKTQIHWSLILISS